ncbi:hypothetical protein [Streptomyces sp. KL116D]|uniref:hypothetical protein n=1 Tax=Streptomyces sp. KL116D TaxID=3045152 RepID=UPI0035568DC5
MYEPDGAHHMDALADLMQRRTPTADVTAQQLRDRSWWRGPTVYVIIDDYDLVSTSSGNPLAGLTELLPFARDVGVRFIIARSTAGGGRASYENFMQRIKEPGRRASCWPVTRPRAICWAGSGRGRCRRAAACSCRASAASR